MSKFEPKDLVELRVRGEFVDVIGLLTQVSVEILDSEAERAEMDRAEKVVSDLIQQTKTDVNYGLAEKQLKRMVRNDEVVDYRGIDARVHEFDPRHPDEESELDVNDLPPFEEANMYSVVMETEEGIHMAAYPDDVELGDGLQLASAMRIYARQIEERLQMGEWDDE